MRRPGLIRVDARFYEAYLEAKRRGEVRWITEFQRRILDQAAKENKSVRFFK